MSRFSIRRAVGSGQFGYRQITEIGLCNPADQKRIENNVVTRWKWVTVPQTSGAVFKALDGARVRTSFIRAATENVRYKCVKIEAVVTPRAPSQTGGTHSGSAVLEYRIVWQQVGNLS